jgi:predicted metal-dependent hydrolase
VDAELRRTLIVQLNRDATRIAARFGLRHRAVEAEPPQVRRRYGVCYADGTIRIRLAHAVSGEPLRYSSLVATLCHELAHLRHFDHGLRFRAFNRRILEWARESGIYRPRSEPPPPAARPRPPPAARPRPAPGRALPAPEPRQLTLFP